MDSGTQADKDATAFYQTLAPLLADKIRGNDFYRSLTVAAEKQDWSEKETHLFPPELYQVTDVGSVEEVIEQVSAAIASNTILRVIGSKHSARDAIYSESEDGDGEPTTSLLCLTEDLKSVEIVEKDDVFLTCRVGAGCRIGRPPSLYCSDKTTDEKWEDSLCYQVEQYGYGIPILGGVTYQTVGGFLMTGSAGGSVKHGFSDFIREIEFVDGDGKRQTATPETDLWSAVGVSMGLFGIITHVTLRLPKVRLIQGTEVGYKYEDSSLDKSRLQTSLENNEYFRLNWFPQKGVNRVQEWSGMQVKPNEAEKKPYISSLSHPLAAGMASVVLGLGNYILEVNPSASVLLKGLFIAGLNLFVPLGTDKQIEFHEKFYLTLPMDNDVHVHTFIRVHFTEIWMPISECENIIAKLNALFEQNDKAAGNFATEIYAAKECKFWLGMSYGGQYVRVDPYWWQWNKGEKDEFFTYYWDALLDVKGARLHWGKYLPKPGKTYGGQTFNLEYLKSVYPKMGKWLEMRNTYDPHQIFVTKYWRGILEIPALGK